MDDLKEVLRVLHKSSPHNNNTHDEWKGQKWIKERANAILLLEARIAELEKDAARYRWLRDEAPNTPNSKGNIPAVLMTNRRGYAIVDSDNFPSWLFGDGLDSLIDAAIKDKPCHI